MAGSPDRSELKLLSQFLFDLSDTERRSEIKRQVLAEHKSFQADSLYFYLARESPSRGISLSDLQAFFNEHGLEVEVEDLQALLALFDFNRDGVLDRGEFKKTVLSQEQGFAETMPSSHSRGKTPSLEVQISLLKIFDEELGGLKTLEKLKKEVRNRGQAFHLKTFDYLDSDKKSYIDVRDIYEFLNEIEPTMTYTKATRILRRLDRDCDNKVSLEEWEASFESLHDSQFNPFSKLGRDNGAPHKYSQKSQEHPRLATNEEADYNPFTALDGGSSGGGYSREVYPAYTQEKDRRGLEEVSYQVSPATQTPHSLMYSKSPYDREGIQKRRQETFQSTRERRGPLHLDTVVVHDKSPERPEKRTYLMKKYDDGYIESEERVCETMSPEDLKNKDIPPYKIERYIHEAKDQPRASRSPISKPRDGYGESASYKKYVKEKYTVTEDGEAPSSSFKKTKRDFDDFSGFPAYSPLKNLKQRPNAYTYKPVYNRPAPPKYEDEEELPIHNLQEQGYSFKDKDFYGAYEEKPRFNSSTAQKEKEHSRTPLRSENSGTINSKQSRQRYEEQEKNLEEEIITHVEHDPKTGKDTKIYVRKIYSPNSKLTMEAENDDFIRVDSFQPSRQDKFAYQGSGQISGHFLGQEPRDRDPYQLAASGGPDFPKHFHTPERTSPETTDYKLRSAKLGGSGPTDYFETENRRTYPKGIKLASSADYVRLVKAESEKFKKRDELSEKLSPDYKFSNLSSDEKNELVDCLTKKVELFRKIETLRIELSKVEGFSIQNLFKHLEDFEVPKEKSLGDTASSMAKGVNFEAFKALFESLGLEIDEKLVKLVFVRNDYDNDGTLNFFEFSELIAPFEPQAREAMGKGPVIEIDKLESLPEGLKRALVQLLNSLVKYEQSTDSTREVTQHRLYSLFNVIDQSNKGLIVLGDLLTILELHDVRDLQEIEIIGLIRKFDLNLDGKISIKEFIDEMSPLRNSKPFETLRNKGY